MMIVPQPKSGELLDILTPSLIKGENLLSEIEVRRVIVEARKLPDRYQGLSIEGLVRIVCDDLEEGYSLLERALALAPYDAVSWGNFSRVVGNKAFHSKQLEILKRSLVVREPALLVEALIIGAFWADMELLDKVVPMVRAMEIQLSEPATQAIAMYERMLGYGDKAKQVSAVAKVVMSVAERHHLPSDISRVDDDDEGLMGFCLFVNTDDADYIQALNNELLDEMIDAGLETGCCVGFFEPGGKECL